MNLDKILTERRGFVMNYDKANDVGVIVEALEACFTTKLSRIEKVEAPDDSRCVLIYFTTPYLSGDLEHPSLLPSLFRIADAVSLECVGSGDDVTVRVLFVVHVWDPEED